MRLVVNRIASYRRSRVNNYVVDSERPISRSVESVPLERERERELVDRITMAMVVDYA